MRFLCFSLLLAACGSSSAGDDDGVPDAALDGDGSPIPADAGGQPDAQPLDCSPAGSGWVRLGSELTGLAGSATTSAPIRIQLGVEGVTPSVAWVELPGQLARVASLTGGEWALRASPISTSGPLELAVLGETVVFRAGDAAGGIHLVRWDGAGWSEPTGGPLNDAAIEGYEPMHAAQIPGGTVTAFGQYYSGTGGNRDLVVVTVGDDGSVAREHPRAPGWSASEDVTAQGVYRMPDGSLSVLVNSGSGGQVLRKVGSSWDALPATLGPSIWSSSQAADGTIYATGVADHALYRLDGSSWTQIAGARDYSAVVDGSGRAISLDYQGNVVQPLTWNGSSWQPLGPALQDCDWQSRSADLKVDGCGRPLLALACDASSNAADRVEVYRYDGD